MSESMDDHALLRQFAQAGSQTAFRELVGRYANLVYASALTRVRDAHAAHDVSQAVFLTLALKAKDLRSDTSLPGWLFTTTRYVAARYQRGEQRRQEREMRAFEQQQIDQPPADNAAWEAMCPHLAEALEALSGSDREAVLMRFYRQASHREIAERLRVSEDAAAQRVHRSLGRLRQFFAKRGVVLSSAALVGGLTASASAAPAGLAASAGAAALAGVGGTVTATSTMTLAQGAMKAMFIAKIQTAVLVTAAAIAVGGAGVTAVVAVAKDQAKPAAPVAAPAVTATNAPAAQITRTDPAAVVITPRTWNAWEAFDDLDRKGGPRVVLLGGTDQLWGSQFGSMGVGMMQRGGTRGSFHVLPSVLCLLVPPELRFVPVEGRKLIEVVAASRRLKTAWSRDGRVAVLHEGVPDAEVDVLRKELASPDAGVRRDAAWRAGWMRDVRVVPLLVKAAKDADARTARKAVEGLRRLNWIAVAALDETAIDLLAAELDLTAEKDAPNRRAAVGALAYPSGEQRLAMLEKALADKDIGVRVAAARSLGYVGGDRAVVLLEKALAEEKSGVGFVPAEVGASLARLGGEKAWAILEKRIASGDITSRNWAFYGVTLADGDKAATLALLEKACADQDVNVRRTALKALGRVGGDKALALIEKALGDWSDHGSVHNAAVQALGQVGGERAMALIEKMFNAGGVNDRRDAAYALALVGDDKALVLLEKALLGDKSDGLGLGRTAAAYALSNYGGDKALALIEKALADQNENVREHAAEALGTVGDEKALALIEKTISDARVGPGRGGLAGAAAEALVGYMDSDKGMDLIQKTLGDFDSGVRRAAAIVLFHAVGNQALPLIEKAYALPDVEMRRAAVLALCRIGPHKALALLEKAMTDLDADVRRAAAEALKELGGEKALAILGKALVSQDAGISQAAITAIGHEGGEKARDLLLGRLAAEKDRNLLMAIVNVLRADFPDDPAVEKALKAFKLPDLPKP